MAKKIRFLNAHFGAATITPKASETVTSVTINAAMDQIIADALGVKETVYRRRKEEDDAGVDGFDLDLELFGAKLVIKPTQGTLNGKVKTDVEFELPSLKMSDFKIKRHKDDQQLLMSWKVMVIDEDAHLHQLMHDIRKADFNCDVLPASKKAAADAQDQLKLAMKGSPEGEEGEGEGDSETVQ